MAFATINEFPQKDIRIASIFKALSHPGRVAILRVLAEKQSCICGELVSQLPMAHSTVSQHLKVLKQAGFVKGEIDGPRSCYCLDYNTIKEVEKLWSDFSEFLNDRACSPNQC
jgi:DNA-binding transcriptional ArsR family regulator